MPSFRKILLQEPNIYRKTIGRNLNPLTRNLNPLNKNLNPFNKRIRLGRYLWNLIFPKDSVKNKSDLIKSLDEQLDEASKIASRKRLRIEAIKKFLSRVAPQNQHTSQTFLNRFISSITNLLTNVRDRLIRGRQIMTPSQAFERALEQRINTAREDIIDLANRLMEGQINISQFRESLVQTIKRVHLEAAFLGLEGMQNITPNIPTLVARRISQQIRFIDSAVAGVVRGHYGVNDLAQRAVANSGLWSNNGRITSYQVQRQALSDFAQSNNQQMYERRVLGAAEHCDGCVELADSGLQPIGTLPAIGVGTPCGLKCQCRFEYWQGREGLEPDDDVGV